MSDFEYAVEMMPSSRPAPAPARRRATARISQLSVQVEGMPPLKEESDESFEPHSATVDSSAQIWSVYLQYAAKEDRALVESWKGDMDGILIFAGLFSAVITAFEMASYQWLQPDNSAVVAFLLLLNATGSQPDAADFKCPIDIPGACDVNTNPSSSVSLAVNACWLLSLVFSLSCALAATLIQQWARAYIQSSDKKAAPRERARRRTYLHRGVAKFGVRAVVEGVPMLLHISLILFFAGLVIFLWNPNPTLGIIVLVCIILFVLSYLALTILPAIFFDAPYRTPLTFFFDFIFHSTRIGARALGRRSQAVERLGHHAEAKKILEISGDLDLQALRWTMNKLLEENELDSFIALLPVLRDPESGEAHDASKLGRERSSASRRAHIYDRLLFQHDMLGQHVARLFRSSTQIEMLTSTPERQASRAAMYLSVVAALAGAACNIADIPPSARSSFVVQYYNPVVREVIFLCKESGPNVSSSPKSTMVPAVQRPYHVDSALPRRAWHTQLLLTYRALRNYRDYVFSVERLCTRRNWPSAFAPRGPGSLRAALEGAIDGGYLQQPLRDLLLACGTDNAYLSSLVNDSPLLNQTLQSTLAMVNNGGDWDAARWATEVLLRRAKDMFCAFYIYARVALQRDAAASRNSLGLGISLAQDGASEVLHALETPLAWEEQGQYESGEAILELFHYIFPPGSSEGAVTLSRDSIVAEYLLVQPQKQPPVQMRAQSVQSHHPRQHGRQGTDQSVTPTGIGCRMLRNLVEFMRIR